MSGLGSGSNIGESESIAKYTRSLSSRFSNDHWG